jgi:RNA polymerase sigma-70 factor (ECF subfamily)
MSEIVKETFVGLIVQNKESEAYKILAEHYHPSLLSFATAFLKSKEPAEEVVNDVLYNILLKREKVREINNLRIYLFTAVRNSCLTIIQKSKRDQELILNISQEKQGLVAYDPESILITGELRHRLKITINGLPPRCKLIYEMIFFEGMRNKDVAQKLNISVNTIDVQLAIAQKRLIDAVSIFNQGTMSRKRYRN